MNNFLVPLFLALCIAKINNANPIVELEQIEASPNDNIEVEIIDADSGDVTAERNGRQFNFGVGFGYGGNNHHHHGGYGGYGGGYGGYNGYGGYPHNHGHYAPSYGHGYGYNPGYYNNYNGFDNHHHGYDHHHHHHGHYRRAFNDEFVPELVPNYLPQRPFISYADDPSRVVSPGFLGSKPIQNEVQIPVSVISDNPGEHFISPIKIPLKQDEGFIPEYINKEVIQQSVDIVQENVKENKIAEENNKTKDDKTDDKECTCKNKKEEKIAPAKKN